MLCIDCGIAWWSLDLLECRIYTTNVEMALRLTLGALQIQLEHWFCHHQLSHYTQSRTLFYLWRSREWLTLSSVLEIVHYYDVCPFAIFFSWRRGRMVVGFTTTCAINAFPFTTYVVSSNSGFLRILRIPQPIKLTSTI